MRMQPNSSRKKLITSAAALNFSQSGTGNGGVRSNAWRVVQVGSPGKETYVARYDWSNPGQPFASVMVELGYEHEESMIGMLRLPRGLSRSDGVRLQIDDGEVSSKRDLAGMKDTGALVLLKMRPEIVRTLRVGETFNIHAHASSNRRQIIFSVPLAGFAEASDDLKKLVVSGAA